MTQSKNGNLDLKMKALVVADDATMTKIMDNYRKQTGYEKTATPDNDIQPQGIFWLRKKVRFPEDRSK